jgi:hypothetical protein
MKLHPADLVFIAIVATYILTCWVVTLVAGLSDRFMPLMYLGTGVQITGVALFGYVLYRLCRALFILLLSLRAKRSNPGKIIINDLKFGPMNLELWRRAVPIFIAFFFFFSTFTSMKFIIADIKPFAWDEYFAYLDRFIHFGVDPWKILHPVLGYPVVTKIISFVYILWLPMFFMVLYWQLFRIQRSAPPPDASRLSSPHWGEGRVGGMIDKNTLRMRFFYTFALSWAINGTFLAIVFSSGGPCFYKNITGGMDFEPLMDYLRAANETYKIYAVGTQELLWRNYMDKGVILGGGISAFPSIHVGTAFLFVLMARHVNRIAFAFFTAFFILIFFGSVHLGWHYAVDGYFSIATTWGIWKFTKFRHSE